METLQLDMTLATRVLLSIFFGFALGFEREITGKFAGLRTHILVSLGACIFTIISIYGFQFVTVDGVAGINDPARIAAQIITGIGFIGAGTVMRHGTNISGITTAATLWVSAAVGMSCGCGMFILSGMSTLAALLVLISIRHFERRFLFSKFQNNNRQVKISFSCDAKDADSALEVVKENFKTINKIDTKIEHGKDFGLKLVVVTQKPIFKINEVFSKVKNIHLLEIREVQE